jgi:hypothetical protein
MSCTITTGKGTFKISNDQKYAFLNILPDIIFDLPAGWLSSQENWPIQLFLPETWSNISTCLWWKRYRDVTISIVILEWRRRLQK